MKERDRNKIDDYADCIDDDYSIVDADDSVCDDDDGLTPGEIKAYREECEVLQAFSMELYGMIGFFDMHLWRNPLVVWR